MQRRRCMDRLRWSLLIRSLHISRARMKIRTPQWALAMPRIALIGEVTGGATVIVTCHPTKSPNLDNLLPRGSGAFLAEVDGNFVCLKHDGGVVDLHWQGKFRGPDFPPILFKIEAGTTDLLKDRKGRAIWTVTARPLYLRNAMRWRPRVKNVKSVAGGDAQLPQPIVTSTGKGSGLVLQDGEPNKTL